MAERKAWEYGVSYIIPPPLSNVGFEGGCFGMLSPVPGGVLAGSGRGINRVAGMNFGWLIGRADEGMGDLKMMRVERCGWKKKMKNVRLRVVSGLAGMSDDVNGGEERIGFGWDGMGWVGMGWD